jgi:hypothetical protein
MTNRKKNQGNNVKYKKQYFQIGTVIINCDGLKNIDFDKLNEKSNLFFNTF